jgi:hypothetical protein
MTVVDVPISRPTDASGKQRPQGLGIEASISFHSISFFACRKKVLARQNWMHGLGARASCSCGQWLCDCDTHARAS